MMSWLRLHVDVVPSKEGMRGALIGLALELEDTGNIS